MQQDITIKIEIKTDAPNELTSILAQYLGTNQFIKDVGEFATDDKDRANLWLHCTRNRIVKADVRPKDTYAPEELILANLKGLKYRLDRFQKGGQSMNSEFRGILDNTIQKAKGLIDTSHMG